MNYPSELLPCSSYKLITCDLSKHLLIRYTDSSKKEDYYDSVLQEIKENCICSPKHNMNDLSTSLLGVYTLSHIHIELTDEGRIKYNGYCQPDNWIVPPVFQEDFQINLNRGYWVVLIGDIDGKVADYTKSNLPFKAKCSIQHTPAKWNYWHFSIRWDLGDGKFWHELPEAEIVKLAKRLGNETRAILKKFAKIDFLTSEQIKSNQFCKFCK